MFVAQLFTHQSLILCVFYCLGCKLVPERILLKRATLMALHYVIHANSESIYSGAMKRIMYFIVLIAQTQLAISCDQREKP